MAASDLAAALAEVEATGENHNATGRALFEACHGDLFPMDALAMTVLDRSLSLVQGFTLLVRNGGYTPAAGLVRMQLDNVIRLHGITSQPDPHDVASRVIAGKRLDQLRGVDGKRMRDANLRALLSKANPWVDHVYSVSSGYVHLSDQHVRHFMQRSAINAAGSRDVAIGTTDDYLRDEQRIDLVNAFCGVTRNVLKVVSRWVDHRDRHGDRSELAARFPHRL